MKTGLRRLFFSTSEPVKGPFFKFSLQVNNYPDEWKEALKKRTDRLVSGHLQWFHVYEKKAGNPPDWFYNPFNGQRLNNPDKHWTQLSDFDLNTGDVKIIWEPSRFDWLTDLARAYRVFGDQQYLDTINEWLKDWSKNNPKNIGPNWKCGQETSIRVMKLFITAYLLRQETRVTPGLYELVYEHLQRISSNIRYAMAQNNNHGTSEAAGLYIGATWLLEQDKQNTKKTRKLRKWKQRGRNYLENRILELIASEGTFSQKSVNYHRVVVDTMSWVLHAMELFDEDDLSDEIIDRLEKLGEWQYKFIVGKNGNAPNMGANDGAMLETLHECDYRDFRPSIQLFFGLLKNKRVYDNGPWDESLFWRLGTGAENMEKENVEVPAAEVIDETFVIIRKRDIKVFVKIPNDNFRPSNDSFHVDVWHKGENLLISPGSYSYNAGSETKKFKSITSHNTVQFGNNEPMPYISRFLLGEWIKADSIGDIEEEGDSIKWKGSYLDYCNNRHGRSLKVDDDKIVIIDEVSSDNDAVFNLHTPYELTEKFGNSSKEFESSKLKITFKGVSKTKKEVGKHSYYYLNKEENTWLRARFRNKVVKTILEF